MVDEWAARFFEELDYINEGENGTLFSEMMKKDLPQVFITKFLTFLKLILKFNVLSITDQVVVQKTYPKYTSRKVLTTSWIEGEKLSQSTENDVDELVNVGVICYLKQVGKISFYLFSNIFFAGFGKSHDCFNLIKQDLLLI